MGGDSPYFYCFLLGISDEFRSTPRIGDGAVFGEIGVAALLCS